MCKFDQEDYITILDCLDNMIEISNSEKRKKIEQAIQAVEAKGIY